MDTDAKAKRRKLENSRSNNQHKPKFKPHLSDQTKIGILQQKLLQLQTQTTIAKQFDVSRATVNRMTEDQLSPEAKLEFQTFAKKLEQARGKIIQRINEKLDNDTFKDGVYPNLLTAVNNAHRLETGQSTSNVSVQGYAQILAKWITEHAPEPELITRKIDAICDAQGLTNAQAQELRNAVLTVE